MRGGVVFVLVCFCALTAVAAWGEQHHWMVGQSLKQQIFADQHGRVHAVDETTRLLLFAPDRLPPDWSILWLKNWMSTIFLSAHGLCR